MLPSLLAAWASLVSLVATALQIDLTAKEMTVGQQSLKEGEIISIDGATGEIFQGSIETTIVQQCRKNLKLFLPGQMKRRRLDVRANADTPEDAKVARAIWCSRHWTVPHRTYVHESGKTCQLCKP